MNTNPECRILRGLHWVDAMIKDIRKGNIFQLAGSEICHEAYDDAEWNEKELGWTVSAARFEQETPEEQDETL